MQPSKEAIEAGRKAYFDTRYTTTQHTKLQCSDDIWKAVATAIEAIDFDALQQENDRLKGEVDELKESCVTVNNNQLSFIHENAGLKQQLADLRARMERYHDLVRYQRAELHEAQLITDAEYAELVKDGKSVARLEGYDALQQQLADLRAENEKLKARDTWLSGLEKTVSDLQMQLAQTQENGGIVRTPQT